MNKVTQLFGTIEERPNNDALREYFAIVSHPVPTKEEIKTHLSENNQENWKLINCVLIPKNNSFMFFWEKNYIETELVE